MSANTLHPTENPAFENLRISEDMDDPDWDEFLAKTPGGHHVQTSRWSLVKNVLHWKTLRLVASDSQGILCGAQLLIRPITSLVRVAYLTKGPVIREGSPPIAQEFLQTIVRTVQKRNIQLLAVQPPNNGQEITNFLPRMNFRLCPLDLGPTASIVLDLSPEPEQLLKGIKRQTRQNIHRGEKAGLLAREGGAPDLKSFYALHQATAKRQSFLPYSFEYYTVMWHAFQSIGDIGLVIVEHNEEMVSALLLVAFGDTVTAKILGWSGKYADLRPNDMAFWNAVLWSKRRGYRYFDFEGIDQRSAQAVLAGNALPDDLRHSPDFIKMGYGGRVVTYPPAFDFVPNPLLRWAYTQFSSQTGGRSVISRVAEQIRKVR